VYGAWANNTVPLDEQAMIRPNAGYDPAAHDAECERLLREWQDHHVDRVVTCLRIAPVVGAGASTIFARAASGRPPAVVRGMTPPVQVVHVDDAASALALAVSDDLDGVFNVAADGWLDYDEAAAIAPHRRPPAVPEEMASTALGAMWGSGLGDAPPEVLPYMMHPWVIANDRLKAHGWQPKHTNEEAILLAGDPDARRRPLPWIAAVGAVLAGAGAATWWLARHRHRS
jgi:UDP-glucose 4-epimerase